MSAKKKISFEDIKNDPALRERAKRGLEVARALDANAPALPYSRVLSSYEFEDFISELTPKRLELLRLAARHLQSSISELAAASKRDQGAVSKDITRLQELGLVRVEVVSNAGHGRKKVVSRIADQISIDANFAMHA